MKLKLIKSKDCEDLIAGIKLVHKYMPKDLSVNSNELVYWIDNYNEKYDDKFFCYVIKDEEKVIGWFQMVSLNTKFVFIDYLVIDEEYRNKTKEILSLIAELLVYCPLIVIECGKEVDRHDLVVKLYKQIGFKQFDIDYKEPKVNVELYNNKITWSSVDSTLFYNGILTLNIKSVLEEIYFNHYYRWYSMHDLHKTNYMEFLNDLINKTI